MSDHEPSSGGGNATASGNELGAFLRSRREGVSPAEVGLPAGGRRRTPGLRRAELATLAGVSIDYLVRLEQGRDRHPSTQVLAAVADALRLPTAERVQLRLLAKVASGHDPLLCPTADEPSRSVRPTVRALLDQLEPAPATVVNRLGDVLAHTTGYARLVGPVGLLDTVPPNLARYVFIDPRARTAFPDWDGVADQEVSNLRLESSRSDPHGAELVEELTVTSGAPFTDRLAAPPSLPDRTGVLRLAHPEVGELRLAYETIGAPRGRRPAAHRLHPRRRDHLRQPRPPHRPPPRCPPRGHRLTEKLSGSSSETFDDAAANLAIGSGIAAADLGSDRQGKAVTRLKVPR